MEKKILLAVDGSEKGYEAVGVVGQFLKDSPDLKIVLFHCVQQIASLLPEELFLSVDESFKVSFSNQEKAGKAVLDEAGRRLIRAGFPEARIECKVKVESGDPAQDILAEAESQEIRTIALGRRGRGQIETLLLGSVSGKVAQYAKNRTVWIVDAPVHDSRKVLIPLEGAPDARELAEYASQYMASIPQLQFTFLHLVPPVPPTFWDDGHILGSSEQKDRQSRVERWRTDWTQKVEKFMAEARSMLIQQGVPEQNVSTLILPTKEGIARDLLNEITEHRYQMVLMGKKNFHERKPFLMGSHSNKVLQNVKGTILSLIDS